MKKKFVVLIIVLIFALVGLIFFPRVITIHQSVASVPTAMNPNFLDQVNQCLIPVASVYGYDLYVTSGFRSMAEQGACSSTLA